jgi:phosphatidylinositol alpha-1,6-mannosyltransferase
VVHGETGLLVDPTDHVAVADAVSGLLLDPDQAAALGRAGVARARHFAWDRVSERVEELLIEVASGT